MEIFYFLPLFKLLPGENGKKLETSIYSTCMKEIPIFRKKANHVMQYIIGAYIQFVSEGVTFLLVGIVSLPIYSTSPKF